jgi:hypothetical protein
MKLTLLARATILSSRIEVIAKVQRTRTQARKPSAWQNRSSGVPTIARLRRAA